MDNDLIDRQLIDLLRMPQEFRTPANIAEAISRISATAHIEIAPTGRLQREQMKLVAIVEFLAAELKISQYDISLTLREHQDASLTSLCAYMRDDATGTKLIGLGSSAEAVLRDLHPLAENREAA